MPSNVTVEDITGRIVEVGDRIAYPVRRRSEMELKQARVESIRIVEDMPVIYARNPQGREVVITSLDRIVLIPQDTPR